MNYLFTGIGGLRRLSVNDRHGHFVTARNDASGNHGHRVGGEMLAQFIAIDHVLQKVLFLVHGCIVSVLLASFRHEHDDPAVTLPPRPPHLDGCKELNASGRYSAIPKHPDNSIEYLTLGSSTLL